MQAQAQAQSKKQKLESESALGSKSALKHIRRADSAPPCEDLTPEDLTPEDLTPKARASEVQRIKDTLEGLEDLVLPYKIADALPRNWVSWQWVPPALIGNLTDVVTIEFLVYFGAQSLFGMPIYVSLKETSHMDDDQLAKALYDATTVAAAMASISCLHNAGDAALLALLDSPSVRLRAAPDPDEMMLHMTAKGIDIGYHGAPEAKFTFQGLGNSDSLAALIIKNAPQNARRAIQL